MQTGYKNPVTPPHLLEPSVDVPKTNGRMSTIDEQQTQL